VVYWCPCSTPKRRSHPDVLLLRLWHMVGFQKVELDNSVDQEEGRAQHPPESDVPGQGLGDGGPPELDADEQLRDDDSDHHPALPTQFAAFGVVQKFKGFAQRNSSPKQDEKEANWVEEMIWGNPHHKLQVECVELSDEETSHKADDSKPPLKAGKGIPLELNPTMGRELTKESLDFTPVSGNLIESSPVVSFQSQPPQSVDA